MESMAMAALDIIGPVPFKDVTKEDEGYPVISPPAARSIDTQLRNNLVTGRKSFQRCFKSRPGDVLLASPPKCGTTWLKALSFATMARATYPPSAADHPLRRLNPHDCVPFMEELFSAGHEAKLEALPSPRLLHTHMHYSMLPRSLTGDDPDCKIVFVCREPKDMLVSLWHFLKIAGFNYNLPDLFEMACEGAGLDADAALWDHVLGYWSASKASPGRVLFLRYEEMLVDTVSTVRDLARFLGMPFSAAEEAAGSPMEIASMCSIDTMRGVGANKTGNSGIFFKSPNENFFRKGVVGDWANHMTPEMARRIDSIVEDKLRGSGLTFASSST